MNNSLLITGADLNFMNKIVFIVFFIFLLSPLMVGAHSGSPTGSGMMEFFGNMTAFGWITQLLIWTLLILAIVALAKWISKH